MGVISDAIDALEDWCVDLFKDGIKSQFDGISSLLTDTFKETTGSGGLVSDFLTKHPVYFTGGAATGKTVWTTRDHEKLPALKLLMAHYHNGKDMPFSTAAIPRTLVYAFEVESITGKRKPVKQF